MSGRYPKYEDMAKGKKAGKLTLWDRIAQFFRNARRIVKVANKPDRKEYFMVFKIVAIGMVVLGVLSYVIQLILSVVLPIGQG